MRKATPLPAELKRTSKVYFWFLSILAGLAFINYAQLFESMPVLGELFGILFATALLLMALPATLLFVSAWIKFWLSLIIPSQFTKYLGAWVLILLIYTSSFIAIKILIPAEKQANAFNLGFKFTIFIIIIAFLWVFIYGASGWIIKWLADSWYKITGNEMNPSVAVSLYGVVFLLLYQGVSLSAKYIPLVEWIFGQKLG